MLEALKRRKEETYFKGYSDILELKRDIEDKKEKVKQLMETGSMERAIRVWNTLEETSYFRDPASARYHNAIYGGLFLHSFNIISHALAESTIFTKKLRVEIDKESIIIASLLHDACKIGRYGVEQKRIQNPEYANDKTKGYGWETKYVYAYSKDYVPYGHGMRSMQLALKAYGNLLTEEEYEAIAYHMADGDDATSKDFHNVFKSNPLAFVIYVSDLYAGYYQETQGDQYHLVYSEGSI